MAEAHFQNGIDYDNDNNSNTNVSPRISTQYAIGAISNIPNTKSVKSESELIAVGTANTTPSNAIQLDSPQMDYDQANDNINNDSLMNANQILNQNEDELLNHRSEAAADPDSDEKVNGLMGPICPKCCSITRSMHDEQGRCRYRCPVQRCQKFMPESSKPPCCHMLYKPEHWLDRTDYWPVNPQRRSHVNRSGQSPYALRPHPQPNPLHMDDYTEYESSRNGNVSNQSQTRTRISQPPPSERRLQEIAKRKLEMEREANEKLNSINRQITETEKMIVLGGQDRNDDQQTDAVTNEQSLLEQCLLGVAPQTATMAHPYPKTPKPVVVTKPLRTNANQAAWKKQCPRCNVGFLSVTRHYYTGQFRFRCNREGCRRWLPGVCTEQQVTEYRLGLQKNFVQPKFRPRKRNLLVNLSDETFLGRRMEHFDQLPVPAKVSALNATPSLSQSTEENQKPSEIDTTNGLQSSSTAASPFTVPVSVVSTSLMGTNYESPQPQMTDQSYASIDYNNQSSSSINTSTVNEVYGTTGDQSVIDEHQSVIDQLQYQYNTALDTAYDPKNAEPQLAGLSKACRYCGNMCRPYLNRSAGTHYWHCVHKPCKRTNGRVQYNKLEH